VQLAYNTVLSIFAHARDEGLCRTREEGRAHVSARVAREAARHSALRQLSDKLFKGSSSC